MSDFLLGALGWMLEISESLSRQALGRLTIDDEIILQKFSESKCVLKNREVDVKDLYILVSEMVHLLKVIFSGRIIDFKETMKYQKWCMDFKSHGQKYKAIITRIEKIHAINNNTILKTELRPNLMANYVGDLFNAGTVIERGVNRVPLVSSILGRSGNRSVVKISETEIVFITHFVAGTPRQILLHIVNEVLFKYEIFSEVVMLGTTNLNGTAGITVDVILNTHAVSPITYDEKELLSVKIENDAGTMLQKIPPNKYMVVRGCLITLNMAPTFPVNHSVAIKFTFEPSMLECEEYYLPGQAKSITAIRSTDDISLDRTIVSWNPELKRRIAKSMQILFPYEQADEVQRKFLGEIASLNEFLIAKSYAGNDFKIVSTITKEQGLTLGVRILDDRVRIERLIFYFVNNINVILCLMRVIYVPPRP